MKNALFTIALLVLTAAGTAAQTEKPARFNPLYDGSAFLGAFYTPILAENMTGVAFGFKGFLTERYGLGLSMSYAYKRTTNNFQQPAGSPVLDYFEWGLEQQYNVVNGSRFCLGATLGNSLAMVQLSDWDSVIQYTTPRGIRDRAKPVVTNYFYQVQPGLDFSVRLTAAEKSPVLNLTGKVKYNVMIGPTRFGTTSDFSKPYFGLGLTLNGLNGSR